MNILLSLLLVAQVLSAIGVIVLVLLQHGKGADMGAAFGSGASGSLFGATGSANFLSRVTAGLATVFFVCTLALAMMVNKSSVAPKSVMDQPAAGSAAPSIPATGLPTLPPAGGAASVPGTTPAAPTPAPAASGAPKAGDAAAPKPGGASEIPK